MAAKKKAKKAPAKKKSARKAAKKTVKKAKATARKAARKTVKKAKKAVKAAAKKTPAKKKAPAKKPKQIVGEGDYVATKAFDKDQVKFVKRHKREIPAMGKAAEKALDGPEGKELRDAEAAAAGRSRDTFEP